jgi:hypothetical protein
MNKQETCYILNNAKIQGIPDFQLSEDDVVESYMADKLLNTTGTIEINCDPFNSTTTSNYFRDLENKVLMIEKISGYTIDELYAMFLKGYTLKPPICEEFSKLKIEDSDEEDQ